MAKSGGKDYFGLSWIVSLILSIIPVTCWVLGIVTRFKEGKIVAGILRIFLTFPVIWILDIVFMILGHKIFRLLNI